MPSSRVLFFGIAYVFLTVVALFIAGFFEASAIARYWKWISYLALIVVGSCFVYDSFKGSDS